MGIPSCRIAFLFLLLQGFCRSQEAPDLAELNIDELSKIQVTSASKRSESLAGAPAAIYVVTGEAIRQGGFTTLPEALRMVPGLYAVQTNSHSWQVSTRGFSGINNRKMLVLVDGRSVYSPAFGGAFWELEDIPLENVDRIQIRHDLAPYLQAPDKILGDVGIDNLLLTNDATPVGRSSWGRIKALYR